MPKSLVAFLNGTVTYTDLRKYPHFLEKPDANDAIVGTIGGVDYELVNEETMECAPVGDESPPDALLP